MPRLDCEPHLFYNKRPSGSKKKKKQNMNGAGLRWQRIPNYAQRALLACVELKKEYIEHLGRINNLNENVQQNAITTTVNASVDKILKNYFLPMLAFWTLSNPNSFALLSDFVFRQL